MTLPEIGIYWFISKQVVYIIPSWYLHITPKRYQPFWRTSKLKPSIIRGIQTKSNRVQIVTLYKKLIREISTEYKKVPPEKRSICKIKNTKWYRSKSHFTYINGTKCYDVMIISILASETKTSRGTDRIKCEHYSDFARHRFICIMYKTASDFLRFDSYVIKYLEESNFELDFLESEETVLKTEMPSLKGLFAEQYFIAISQFITREGTRSAAKRFTFSQSNDWELPLP